jgi:hypothetical protein
MLNSGMLDMLRWLLSLAMFLGRSWLEWREVSISLKLNLLCSCVIDPRTSNINNSYPNGKNLHVHSILHRTAFKVVCKISAKMNAN